ncbi:hypothetical protein DENSPDRAFT_788475 [Dentipellis sp. KUC8613]|nr:hypothetical protein DENSPDRAFT_788475 [Dentipellis sp. KUC8613]
MKKKRSVSNFIYETDNELTFHPEKLQAKCTSAIYAFSDPTPIITYRNSRKYHTFTCLSKGCGKQVSRCLQTTDAMSTSNMRKHARQCWGEDVVRAADLAGNVSVARDKVTKPFLKDGSITAAFVRSGKGKITYSHRQHMKTETKAEIVRWVSESLRPFSIVADRGFNSLMKTGRPGYYIPSPSTVSRDVKLVFARARNRIAKLLHEYKGDLNFATDTWSSPNHRAFIALTVHLLLDGEPISILLDLVEVDEVRTYIHERNMPVLK